MAYVQKYTKFEYDDGEKIFGVRHTEYREAEAGFDLTTFPSRNSFQEIINKFDMEYRRIETKDGYLYTWSNEDVMIVTGNNPISGVFRYPNQREKETGYASFIGVQGKEGIVENIAEEINERAKFVKAYNPQERAFI